MGADIHDFCEVNGNGSWEKVGDEFENPYYRPEDPLDDWNRPRTNHPYGMRNYSLFGFLAGVRSDEVPALAQPRGVPEDASGEYKAEVKRWGCDGHSHSYFTLQELLDYPYYDESAPREGYVTLDEYARYKREGHPNSWCGGVGGGMVVHLSNEDMDELVADPDFPKKNTKKLFEIIRKCNKQYPVVLANIEKLEAKYEDSGVVPEFHYYTHITWKQPARECLGEWWFKSLEQMKKLAPDGDYSKVRYVFFFDN